MTFPMVSLKTNFLPTEFRKFKVVIKVKNPTENILPSPPDFFVLYVIAENLNTNKNYTPSFIYPRLIGYFNREKISNIEDFSFDIETGFLGPSFRLKPKEKRKFIINFQVPAGNYKINWYILKTNLDKKYQDPLEKNAFSKKEAISPLFLKKKDENKSSIIFPKPNRIILYDTIRDKYIDLDEFTSWRCSHILTTVYPRKIVVEMAATFLLGFVSSFLLSIISKIILK